MTDSGLRVTDVEAYLKKMFPGSTVEVPAIATGSYLLDVKMGTYEVRVILSGHRRSDRRIAYRFSEMVTLPPKRYPTRRIIIEDSATSTEAFEALVGETRSYLLAQVTMLLGFLNEPVHTFAGL